MGVQAGGGVASQVQGERGRCLCSLLGTLTGTLCAVGAGTGLGLGSASRANGRRQAEAWGREHGLASVSFWKVFSLLSSQHTDEESYANGV